MIDDPRPRRPPCRRLLGARGCGAQNIGTPAATNQGVGIFWRSAYARHRDRRR